MSRVDKCEHDAPHVERVELSPLHILGAGVFWRAARPGGVYLAGHGLHFHNRADAEEWAYCKCDTVRPAFCPQHRCDCNTMCGHRGKARPHVFAPGESCGGNDETWRERSPRGMCRVHDHMGDVE